MTSKLAPTRATGSSPISSRREAKLAVFSFLETFYNPRRRHSALACDPRWRSKPPHQKPLASKAGSVRTPPTCPSCQQALHGRRGRQRFCSAAYRQAAYRARQPHHPDELPPAPARGAIRARAVYQCPHCGTRYLGQQRCPDSNAFCTRTGAGGTCPCCQEVIWR